MKNFDLETAKSGAPIVTRDGREARFIAFVPEAQEPYQVIVYTNDDKGVSEYDTKGKFMANKEDHPKDLFMKPQKRTVWLNLYDGVRCSLYKTEQEAREAVGKNACRFLAIATAIEIEE